MLNLPENAFGYVPTPALVAPLEFMVRHEDYLALGGHKNSIWSIAKAVENGNEYGASARIVGPGPEMLLLSEDNDR